MSNKQLSSRETDVIRRWLSGIPYEVAFWNSYYRNRRRRADLFSWSLYGKECVLDNFDIASFMEGRSADEVVMLDLGCALSYTFGNIVNGRELTTHYVDPLALFYNDILDRYHIDRPRIRFGMAETLATVYPEGSVTFVHIRNALDHSADPMTAILQALEVLEKGGVLYCNHFRNEAERESYRGFHQFNIDMRDEKLIIWNKDETIDVGAVIAPFANLCVSETKEGRVVAVITKTADIPQEVAGCAHAAQTTSRMLMTSVGYFHSAPNAISYQFSRLWSAAGHNLMRLLPYSLLNSVKRWMGNKS